MHIILLKNKTTPADPYEEIIQTQGHSPHFIPLLRHTHLDKDKIVEYLTDVDFLGCDAFIITSQRAVECFNECMGMIKDNEIASRIFSKLGYTVGPATAEILGQSGFKDVRGGKNAGNGSILADIIMQEMLPNKKVIFFTGEIRKDIIPRKLIKAGFDLKERVLYRTEARNDIVVNFQETCDIVAKTPSWLVFFSPQGTESIVEYLVNSDNHGFKIASIGPTTEEYLEEKGIKPLVVAPKPDSKSLLESILGVSELI